MSLTLGGGCSSASCASLPGWKGGGSPPSASRSGGLQLLSPKPHLQKNDGFNTFTFSLAALPRISSMVWPVASRRTTPCSSFSYRRREKHESELKRSQMGKNSKPEAARSGRGDKKGRMACSISQMSQRLLGISPTFFATEFIIFCDFSFLWHSIGLQAKEFSHLDFSCHLSPSSMSRAFSWTKRPVVGFSSVFETMPNKKFSRRQVGNF